MTTQAQDKITIHDIDGQAVEVRLKLPWGKEREILKIIGTALASIPEDLFGHTDRAPGIALMEYLTTQAPEKITLVVSKILGISEEDVDSKFDGDAIFEFIIPFVQKYSEKWNLRLGGLPFPFPGGGMIGTTQPGPQTALDSTDIKPAGEQTH